MATNKAPRSKGDTASQMAKREHVSPKRAQTVVKALSRNIKADVKASRKKN